MGWKFWQKKRESTAVPEMAAAAPAEQSGRLQMASLVGNQAMQQYVSPVRGGVPIPAREQYMQQAANAPAETSAREMEEIQNAPESVHSGLTELYTALTNSRKGGIHGENSKYYNDVVKSLSEVNSTMRRNFTTDVKANHKSLADMGGYYDKLISACQAYISRSPWTAAGKQRKEIVTQIQAQASRDMVALSAVRTDFCSLTAEQQSQKNWSDLLSQSRAIHLTVKNFQDINKASGGQASEVYKLSGVNVSVKGANNEPVPLSEVCYFKPEDEYDMAQSNNAAKIADNAMKRFPGLTGKDRKIIGKWAAETDSRKNDLNEDMKGLSDKGKLAMNFINDQLSSVGTTTGSVMQRMKIDDRDEKVNMTKRNVATSRMAAMLGLEDLVAKSETAEMYDEATGTTIRGNLMAQAKGDMSGSEFAKKAKGGKKNIDLTDTSDIPDVTINTTGKFQRDMCNLQVLDVICGQVDRHQNNFLVSANESGELSGLQGIDNDASFGLNERTEWIGGNIHSRDVYKSDTGEMTLPYMDRNLAERIRGIDPEMIKYALSDLLKEDEIQAVITRLGKLRSALDTMDDSRLLEDDQWNDDTAQGLIDQAWNANRECKKAVVQKEKEIKKSLSMDQDHAICQNTTAYENYFGKYMIEALPVDFMSRGGGREGLTPQLARRKKRNS